MRTRTPERIKEVVLKAHELRSNIKTAELYNVTIQTVRNYRKIYYQENPHEKTEFKRGGEHCRKRIINTIDDLSPRVHRIAMYFKRSPSVSPVDVSKAVGAKISYVYAVRKFITEKGFI